MERSQHKPVILPHRLPDFNFHTEFMEVHGVRISYIHEGKGNNKTILFLHGIPTWSYTFRNLFLPCMKNGFRIIAPDLPGCGLSDCLPEGVPYNLNTLTEILQGCLNQLHIGDSIVFGHDWGAIMGMVLLGKRPEQFNGFVACNGYLPLPDQRVPLPFTAWKFFCRFSPVFPIGYIVNKGSVRSMRDQEINGYNYPYRSGKSKKIHRTLPGLIPFKKDSEEAEISRKTWEELEKWDRPFSTIFGALDPITRSGPDILRTHIPGARWAHHMVLHGGHFVQEDWPSEISKFLIEFSNHCP